MNSRSYLACLIALPLLCLSPALLRAQDMPAPAAGAADKPKAAPTAAPEAAPAAGAAALPADAAENSPPTPERLAQVAELTGEAFTVAGRTMGKDGAQARIDAVRGAASVLPRLEGKDRDALTARWVRLAMSADVPRSVRLIAFDSFFNSASRRDADYARKVALALPDAAARAGAFIDLSNSEEGVNWTKANDDALQAQRAARQEAGLTLRARALTFVAYRMVVLNPDLAEASIVEASSQVRLILTPAVRDNLLTEVVGAAAKFDLGMARKISTSITDPGLKGLAESRVNMSEISQTTLTSATSDRIEALAKAAAQYDVRAIPILLQLPPHPEVLKVLADALPPLYPTASPGIDANTLERMWAYAQTADVSVQRDVLQSRLARCMVLHDLWHGRDWGKQLTWKGGRIQVGAFLKAVAAARRLQVKAEPLQDLTLRNVNRAVHQARTLAPAARTEATLLIAGQLLN